MACVRRAIARNHLKRIGRVNLLNADIHQRLKFDIEIASQRDIILTIVAA